MNLKRELGLDILSERYAYATDAELGFTSAQRIPDRWVGTTCGYCSVGCGMFVGVKDGKAVSVRGNPEHPVNRGLLCPKGLSEHHTIAAATRAKYPLLKKNGKHVRVSWDEALETLVSRFQGVQRKYGPDAFGVLSTGQLVTEEFYALGKLVQLGFGTKNYDGNTTLCMASAVSGYKRSFGSDGPPGAYQDLEIADVILLLGANVADNHPILCQRLEANRKKILIVADPRVTKTAMIADVYLPLKPRSDIALVNGLIYILLQRDLVDRDYIQQHTTGFEALEESIRKYTPEFVSKVTGLSTELLIKTAMLYGHAKAPFLGWTMGVNHSTKGTETVNAINNLALIKGHVGRPGASPFSITGQCNAMGTREAGFTSSLPGYRHFENGTHRAELAALWKVSPDRLPTSRGLAYPDIVEAVLAKKIRALWVIATNPMVSFPNLGVLQQSFESLDFFVVQDGFHPTPTSALADLVIPAAVWGEKEGTYTNSERRVSKVNAAVSPPAEARSDFQIFLDIADKLGCRHELFPGWNEPKDAFEEWKKVSADRLCDYSGMDYSLIEREGGVQWPFPAGAKEVNTSRLYSDGIFPTEDGRARLLVAEWEPFPEQPAVDYPFVLNTGRTVEHWHTRTKTSQVEILERLAPNAWLEMNPRDAEALNLQAHMRVDIVSRRGRTSGVELRVTEMIAPGQLFMPFHFAETNVNEVTQSAFDPVSREPNYKQCAVRVEKTPPSAREIADRGWFGRQSSLVRG